MKKKRWSDFGDILVLVPAPDDAPNKKNLAYLWIGDKHGKHIVHLRRLKKLRTELNKYFGGRKS